MKHVIAIIQPQQLPAVKKSIRESGIEHMSCTNILGTVPNQDEHQSFRGVDHEITLFQKVRLEFFINDEDLDKLIDAVVENHFGARRHHLLDLKICARQRPQHPPVGNHLVGPIIDALRPARFHQGT